MHPSVWILSALVLLGSFDFGNTQRKQQGRNIQVNSEVKQSINFDCPEEFGYYPHPTDCTQYYVCVFGGALLESCTGGLMYSHELQTCDWPRNVGCDGLGDVSSPGGSVSASVSPASRVPEQRVRYTVIPTDVAPSRSQSQQPAAVVSSRGQSRQQLQHSHTHSSLSQQQQQQQQQRQLYADADDVLPPAEEIENDRQQRVYRGQPSTVGQVQRDRDGLRHTNAIPTSSRAEKIGVISFGTQQQSQQPQQQQQQQQQQQPVQQYRIDTLYIDDDSLSTNELTEKRRRKRHVKRRLPSYDSLTTGDSSISWQTRHVPHLVYQPTKLTYQSNRQNSMELQPPPAARYKINNQQVEYSAIIPRGHTSDQSYSSNPNPVSVQLKTNPFVVPKTVDQSSRLLQYYNYRPEQTQLQPQLQSQAQSQSQNSNLNENYSYFNLGTIGTTPSTVVYAPSNQAKVTHAYYHPNPEQPVQYYNEFRPITNTPSQYNKPRVEQEAPRYQKQPYVENKPTPPVPEENEKEEKPEESEEEIDEDTKNSQRDDSIKAEFPSPPPFFFKSTNKYENIRNPFADPNFDFDKFISKVRGDDLQNMKEETTEDKFQAIVAQNDSKGKLVHSKIHPHIDLRTPVAFSSPSNKKKVNIKPPPPPPSPSPVDDDDYYYDDEEEIYEKQKKPTSTTTTQRTQVYSTKKPIVTSTDRNKYKTPVITTTDRNKYKTSVVTTTDRNKYKPIASEKNVPTNKPQDEEYEYYDDYEYEDEKYEKPAPVKKPPVLQSTPKPIRVNHKYESVPKITNLPVINKTILHGNRAIASNTRPQPQTIIKPRNESTSKPLKFLENLKESRTTPTYTTKYTSKIPHSTPRITTIKFPKERPRLLTSTTVRPNRDRDTTTRNTVTKNSSRVEESSQSHPSSNLQSSRTIYNGSQHYDPSQYDPYYTLYEDDVELYRDVDYTPQQQYTSSNRAQQASPQHTYRGTPAPISIKVQSAVQEVAPQRNTAYYNTQSQDVYEPATDYQEDNYNTQVEDQNTYRQSSRQPSRGVKNELSYYVATAPKTTTTIRTTTTTTTTTPRAIPVQKQSVIPSRSPIIATANQTRPQSIIITLSATPGQKSSKNHSFNSSHETATLNETSSSSETSDPKPPNRVISLSSGFSLRQNDKPTELTPSTYKPHFIQISSTTTHSSILDHTENIRPAPFSLTKLPDADTKSVIFRLSSRLSAKSPITSEASESKPSLLNTQSTETPNKREITTDDNKRTHAKTTETGHIVPTTYSPSKTLLASILPKHPTVSLSTTENQTPEIISDDYVSILPKKSNKSKEVSEEYSEQIPQRKSVSIENQSVDERFVDDHEDKPIKTIIRKTPVNAERRFNSGERKIISKIHFGSTFENPERINNLAESKGTENSSTESDYQASQETSSESIKPIVVSTSQRPTAHYITVDLPTSQRPHSYKFNSHISTTEQIAKSSTTESKILLNFESELPSTTRGNFFKYTPPSTTTELPEIKIESTSKQIFDLPTLKLNKYSPPSVERGFVRYMPFTTENNKPKNVDTGYKTPLRVSFNSYTSTESDKVDSDTSSEEKQDSHIQSSDINVRRQHSGFYHPSSSEDEIVPSTEKSNKNRSQFRFSYQQPIVSSTTEQVEYTTKRKTNGYIPESKKERTPIRFGFVPSSSTTTEQENLSSEVNITEASTTTTTTTTSTSETPITSRKPIFKFTYNAGPTTTKDNLYLISSTTAHVPEFSEEPEDKIEKIEFKYRFNNPEHTSSERPRYVPITPEEPERERIQQFKYKFNNPTSTTEHISERTRFFSTSTTHNPEIAEKTEERRERITFKYKFNNPRIENNNSDKTKNTPSDIINLESTSEESYEEIKESTPKYKINSFVPSSTSEASETFNRPRLPGKYSFNNPTTEHTNTDRSRYIFVASSTPESDSEESEYSGEQRFLGKYSNNERSRYINIASSTTESTSEESVSADNHRFIPVTGYRTTERTRFIPSNDQNKPSYQFGRTTQRNVPSSSTSRPSFNGNFERKNTGQYVPTIPTTSTTSTTEATTRKQVESIGLNKYTPEVDTDKVRSELIPNRNTNLFKATVEQPSVSDILENEELPKKKDIIDSLPTYKPKPIQNSTNDATFKNRTVAADSSRNITLPARLSRVNTAIKSLTAFGGTRRNSQTPKCNENQSTPDTKCNEIQNKRTSTRGRGSAHYTNAAPVETVSVNRGTPATPRSRPTLKPSTSIVSKAAEFVDIYRYPPQRPDPIYPQPQVDKTAAKCRKDVCLLPDCSCGGKEIPGELPVEQVPQIVLLTFDDSVNDLNKGLYSDLFEKGRTNPNGCPISATFYVSHEWTDYSQVQNLYSDGHELASHTVSHSFGEQFSQKKWNREVAGQREILAAYGGVHLEDVRGMRAPFLSVGGNKMFKMLYDSNFTYDSSLPVYENRPPSWPYTLDYKLFHDCMIPPCPTRSYPGVWEVPMVMWQDLNGGRCSMGDACSNPADADGVHKMIMKNFERHYTTNRAPFGLFYHAAWFTQPHHKEGFIRFLDYLVSKDDVYVITNWQAIQWVRDPTPLNRIKSFQPFQCNYSDRPKRCNNPKVCNLWHKSGVRYMKTCQPCPDIYPWTGKTGIRSSRIDNDIED